MSLNTNFQLVNPFPKQVLETLLVNRGLPGSNMVTKGLDHLVKNLETYELSAQGLKPSKELFPVDLEQRASNPLIVQTPPLLEIEAKWEKKASFSGQSNNILGDNGRLVLSSLAITVPVVVAEDPTLAFYGATLITNEAIRFPDAEYPIWSMEVGNDYVKDYIMSNEGGGMYLEFHTDQPHFHMPLNGGGYYLLAKWNPDQTKLQMTGFKIPNGQAVYTKKGAIHCDAALTGDLIVGYTLSNDCSTVLLRTEKDEMVSVQFGN